MSDIIKGKINNGEGFIEVESLGIITASKYNQLTDPQWDKTIDDYQDQINFLENEFNINKNNLENDIINLGNDIINIKQELEANNLKELYDKLRTEEKRFNLFHPDIKIVEKEERKFQNDPVIKNLEMQVNEIKNNIFMRIKSKKRDIDNKKLELQELEKKLRDRKKEISNTLLLERQPQNTDYLNNQKLKIIKIFSQHDYKIENDQLLLLTEPEKIEKAKEKRKKEVAKELQNLYPEKVIDGTLNILYDEKVLEIDNLMTIEDIKNYTIN